MHMFQILIYGCKTFDPSVKTYLKIPSHFGGKNNMCSEFPRNGKIPRIRMHRRGIQKSLYNRGAMPKRGGESSNKGKESGNF